MSQQPDIEDVYPLSPMQSGMLFHSLKEPDSGLYVEQVVYNLQGDIAADALRDAWRQVTARHPALRSLFVWENRKIPLQVVKKQVNLPWTALDLRELSPEEKQQHVEAYLKKDRQQGFALNRPPLMRFSLMRQSRDTYVFIWSHHHILMDGWCIPILFREVAACYRANLRGEPVSLPPVRPFREYITWLHHQDMAAAKAFWKTRLNGFTAPTPLAKPCRDDGCRQTHGPTPHQEEQIELDQDLTCGLLDQARRFHLTLNTFFQAGWAILLSRYSRERDVVFGAVVSGRPQDLPGAASMVGLFINTLPVRARFSSNQSILSCLRALFADQADQTAYSFTPLPEIREAGGLSPDMPLFESILAFENYPSGPSGGKDIPGVRVLSSGIREKTNYPLNLMISPGDRISIKALYDERCFKPAAVRRILRHYRLLLTEMARDPHRSVSELTMLEPGEQHRLVFEFNDTDQPTGDNRCVHHMVRQTAAVSPDRIALVHGDRRLTYGQMDDRAQCLARRVRDIAGPYPRVGIFMPRCPEMIIAMLAVLKAGGAYLPLAPDWPPARIRYILEDAGVCLVLTRGHPVPDPVLPPVPVLDVDGELGVDGQDIPESDPGRTIPDRDFPAYVIYTSGSTGNPKGVMVSHDALANLIAWHHRTFTPQPGDRVGQTANPVFDASAWEIWSCLTAGATLHLLPPDLDGSAEALKQWLLSQQINACYLPTPLAQAMLDLDWPRQLPLAILHTGGDMLQRMPPPDLPFPLVNHYGPTECTVIAVSGTLSGQEAHSAPSRAVPHVGRPIDNIRAYILNHDLTPAPLGLPGELFLAGRGLSMGYLNRPDLTAQHFIPNPFSRKKGERLYKTGDLARYLPDGNIEIIQRLDDQVKIRGFRVETGEIEAVLLAHPHIREAKVLALPQPSGNKRLTAYLACPSDLCRDALRRFLAERLPGYMIPPDMVFLPALPRNTNGKIDRRALPAPKPDSLRGTPHAAPATEVEALLSRIWAEVLNLKNVGVHDDFSALGGDSILSIQIMSRASRHGLHFSLTQLFEHPTIAALAPLVRQDIRPKTSGPTPVSGPVPLTPVQHWFFRQNTPDPHHFNQSMLLKTTPDATPEIIKQIAGLLIAAHPSLRLRFVQKEHYWHQTYGPQEEPVPFTVEDLSALPPGKQTVTLESLTADYQTRLDLTRGPICRFVFFRMGSGHDPDQPPENRLLIVIHHLAVDGISWRILLEDMHTAFEQIRAGRPAALVMEKDSFQTWAERLTAYARSEKIRHDARYWLDKSVHGPEPLPVDFVCAPETNTSESCNQVQVLLDRENTEALLHRVPGTYQTRIDDVLLTALVQTFCRWTGGNALRVTLEGHGRETGVSPHPNPASMSVEELDISRTTGWFTALYPVVLFLENRQDPGRILVGIKEQLRQIPHHGAGFGPLKYLCRDPALKTAVDNAPRVTPWPEVMFNYLGQMSTLLSAPPIAGPATESQGPESSPLMRRDHVLNIGCLIVDNVLRINWIYSGNIHRRRTIEGLARDYLHNLKTLITHCLNPAAGGLTASDVPGARLDQKTLETFLAELESR